MTDPEILCILYNPRSFNALFYGHLFFIFLTVVDKVNPLQVYYYVTCVKKYLHVETFPTVFKAIIFIAIVKSIKLLVFFF